MTINEMIRKLRKEQNYTQEQVANYLGVTAPAVNKWEKGVSYPDITLLGPLARLLDTTINDLLLFNEHLTEVEVSNSVIEVYNCQTTKGYELAFELAEEKIKKYPTCDLLMLHLGQLLYSTVVLAEEGHGQSYIRKIKQWYELLIKSDDLDIVNKAQVALCQLYIDVDQDENANMILDKMPAQTADKRYLQAKIYEKSHQLDEVSRLYEEMIHKSAQELSVLLQLKLSLDLPQEESDHIKFILDTINEQFEIQLYSDIADDIIGHEFETLKMIKATIISLNKKQASLLYPKTYLSIIDMKKRILKVTLGQIEESRGKSHSYDCLLDEVIALVADF